MTETNLMNNEAEISDITVKDAMENLEYSRTTFYRHCDKLSITPRRDGAHSYLSMQEFSTLKAHKEGTLTVIPNPESAITQKTEEDLTLRDYFLMTMATLDNAKNKPSNPLSVQESLEKAYQNEWKLTSKQIAEILDLSPRTISGRGDFNTHGFTLETHGHRHDRLWTVSPQELEG